MLLTIISWASGPTQIVGTDLPLCHGIDPISVPDRMCCCWHSSLPPLPPLALEALKACRPAEPLRAGDGEVSPLPCAACSDSIAQLETWPEPSLVPETYQSAAGFIATALCNSLSMPWV